jgi:hypothetical protein
VTFNRLVMGAVISGVLLAVTSSLAVARTTNCKILIHRYCKTPSHAHGKRHPVHTKSNIAYRATHQTGLYYDNPAAAWDDSDTVDDNRSYNFGGDVGPAPNTAQYSGGTTYNFYGPTTNYFGPSYLPEPAYSPPSPAGYDDGDRMDPWHGYDHNRGLENGY